MGIETPRIDSMEPDKSITKLIKHIPLELHYVKALFLQQQYRQCISTCRQLSDSDRDRDGETRHPLKQTYIQYYLALSHDELARTMHNISHSKASAFSQAESFYQDALAFIPSADDCRQLLQQQKFEQQLQPNRSMQQSSSESTLNSEVFRRPPSPSPVFTPSTTRFPGAPEIKSPEISASEFDDLESHDSFDEIVTPNRLPRLPSTFSSMSLLEPPKQAHGLMRPVRPGSVARPYQVPPQLSPTQDRRRSRLPRLATTSSLGSPDRRSSPVRHQLRAADEEWSDPGSPTSPVSPLGSSYADSDDMTVSPISPSTPMTVNNANVLDATPSQSSVDALDDNIQALHVHIHAQISLLQEAKQRTLASQAERMAQDTSRTAKAAASRHLKARGDMAQSRSFWLFTSEDMKVAERQKRIQEGRDRMWAKKRFDPSRYRQLAEKALAEL